MKNFPNNQLKFRDLLLILSEDDKDFIEIDRILKNFFNNIHLADNETKSSENYTQFKPNLIICETKINNFNVLDFVKKVKIQDSHINIIFISDDLTSQTLLKVIQLGAVDFVPKPIEVGKLIYAINSFNKKISKNNDQFIYITDTIKYDHANFNLHVDDKTRKLTKKETLLLDLLLKNRNRIVPIEEIYQYLWEDSVVTESAFKSMYRRLTTKLGKGIVTNTFGVGYGIFDDNIKSV